MFKFVTAAIITNSKKPPGNLFPKNSIQGDNIYNINNSLKNQNCVTKGYFNSEVLLKYEKAFIQSITSQFFIILSSAGKNLEKTGIDCARK